MRLAPVATAMWAVLLISCSTPPRVAPRFIAPSVVPVKQAITETVQHVQNAQGAAKQLADECSQKTAGWQSAYDQLNKELTDAYMSAKMANDRADALQEANNVIAEQCNGLADNYDKEVARNKSLEESRHGWVKRFWMATIVASLASLWIFRKPLLVAAGGLGGT